MKKWRCTICGYIHEGDTPPDACPLCGAGPEFFEEVIVEEDKVTESKSEVAKPIETKQAVTVPPVKTASGKKWRCTVCGYIHLGDQPPDVCPECGVGPELFEELVDENPPSVVTLTEEDRKRVDPALFKISYGLYVITSKNGDKINGQTANTGFQITSNPPRVAIGINKQNLTKEFIDASGVFTMNILGEQGHNLVRRFGFASGRTMDKFEGIDYSLGVTGAPILKESIAFLECRVIKEMSVDVGTHMLYVADVVEGKVNADAEPMTYAYYRKTK